MLLLTAFFWEKTIGNVLFGLKVPNRSLLDFLAGSSPLLVKQMDPSNPHSGRGHFIELPLPWDLSVGQAQVCHCHTHPKTFCHESECENRTGDMGLSPTLLVQFLSKYQLFSSPGLWGWHWALVLRSVAPCTFYVCLGSLWLNMRLDPDTDVTFTVSPTESKSCQILLFTANMFTNSWYWVN